jgi:choline dehydrogenase-like flavoprotein
MPIVTPQTARNDYDVVIVGSGAGGGQMAMILTLAGIRCLMLEAGRAYDPVSETAMFQRNDQGPLLSGSSPQKDFGFFDATVDGGWHVPNEPYTQASTEPDEQFWWWRSRMLGGRTNHWGRISLRNGPYDFRSHQRDGLGFDWPISYEDLEPYYTKVEKFIGVYGSNEGLENTPNSPLGVLLPPPKGRAAELLIQKHARTLGIPVIPVHRAVLTRALDADTIPAELFPGNDWAQQIIAKAMRARAACFWATNCGRGCSIGANYQSTTVNLPPALATGNLDIIANAHAREVILDKDGMASGVLFVDKTTGREERVLGKAVVLAASSGETVRILLNSRNARFPHGLANTSGRVGRAVMDTVGTWVSGQVPAMENLPPHNEDGAGGSHFYAPWWLYKEQAAGKLGFPRGYHIEMEGSRGMPGGYDPVPTELCAGAYGTAYKEKARRYYGSVIGLSCRGEMIPNENSFADLDPTTVDKWGIPVLRWHWKWSEHELRMVDHAEKTLGDVIRAMGGTPYPSHLPDQRNGINPGGKIIHEVGGAMMGSSPKNSVCNSWNQTWDVPNLILADGATFPSNADKNPTLTLLALGWRAAEHLIVLAKTGQLTRSLR